MDHQGGEQALPAHRSDHNSGMIYYTRS